MSVVADEAGYAQIAALAARAREANVLVELAFSIANDSYALLPSNRFLGSPDTVKYGITIGLSAYGRSGSLPASSYAARVESSTFR